MKESVKFNRQSGSTVELYIDAIDKNLLRRFMATFTFSNLVSLGQFRGSNVYRINLADSGLSSIASVTIKDDNIISGADGANSGLELNWLQISSTFIDTANDIPKIDNLNAFTFSDAAVTFQPGFIRPREGQTELTGTINGKVNFPFATFDVLDDIDRFGRVSLGEAGKISFALNSPFPTSSLYLYIAESTTPDRFDVEISEASAPVDSPKGIELIGTTENDVIDLTRDGNQAVGLKNDVIKGGQGNDILNGGNGSDILAGEEGADILTGGAGSDRFVFSGATRRAALRSSTLKSRDQITDFQFNQGDRFQLDFNNDLNSVELPKRLLNAGTRKGSLKQAVQDVYRDKDLRKDNAQPLKANEAVFFSVGRKTYLSINDNSRGFSAKNDLIAEVTGIQFKSGDLSKQILSVGSYFI